MAWAAARPASRAARRRVPSVARRLTAGEPGAGRMESTAGWAAEAEVTVGAKVFAGMDGVFDVDGVDGVLEVDGMTGVIGVAS